jgi:hypothetical protein
MKMKGGWSHYSVNQLLPSVEISNKVFLYGRT